MKLETNKKKIKTLSEKKHEENWSFRAFLKGYDPGPEEIDKIVHELSETISAQIDCKTCANCCKKALPILNQRDIQRFSAGLCITERQFKKQYLKAEKEEPGQFTFKETPCPFLKENLCSYYEFRPNDCKSFPHLHKKDFVFRLWGIIENCSICPVVYNVYEYLKDEIWYNDFDDYLDEHDNFDEFK
jgi:Fe-S-cluster containining protein